MYEKIIFRNLLFILTIVLIFFSIEIYGEHKNISQVKIIINDKQCEPMQLIVNNKKTQFIIKNDSKRKIEWEILKGVIVVDERENIAPGFTQKITTNLEPGEYNMTCGLLSNPKGTILVRYNNIEVVNQHFNFNKFSSFVIPILQYKKYVINEIENLLIKTKYFNLAIKSNNLKQAKLLFATTRQHYERIESIAELFSDLDYKIDAQEENYKKKSSDPKFIGFHRIEKALFFDQTTKGIDQYADFLYKDILDLKKRIYYMVFTANKVIGGAVVLLEEVAANKISGEEDRYSRTDLWDLHANIDGSKKIIDIFRSIILKNNPQLLSNLDKDFFRIYSTLKKYKKKDGYKNYNNISISDRLNLKGPISSLAENLSLLRGTLDID